MTRKNFQYAVFIPSTNKNVNSMRIMCVDMAEVAVNVSRLCKDTVYAIEEKMDGPFYTNADFAR